MAKLFLDTNYFVGLILERQDVSKEDLDSHRLFLSTLSVHILYYIDKIKVPNQATSKVINTFELINFDKNILQQSLQGPTKDLEDNIQLHSAAEAECNYFLTNDKSLLKMKFFGKTQIMNRLKI